jgi:hypothetical protein
MHKLITTKRILPGQKGLQNWLQDFMYDNEIDAYINEAKDKLERSQGPKLKNFFLPNLRMGKISKTVCP